MQADRWLGMFAAWSQYQGVAVARAILELARRGSLLDELQFRLWLARIDEAASDDQRSAAEPVVNRVRPTFRSIDGAQPPDRVAADLAAAIAAAGNGAAGVQR